MSEQNVDERIAALEVSVQGLNTSMKTLFDKIDAQGSAIAQVGKTEWKSVLPTIGVVLGIVLSGGAVFILPQQKELSYISERLGQHTNSPAHMDVYGRLPIVEERTRALAGELGTLLKRFREHEVLHGHGGIDQQVEDLTGVVNRLLDNQGLRRKNDQ